MKKKKTIYACPHCKKGQTQINRWQTASLCETYDFETKYWETTDTAYGDFESWNCPECGGDLDKMMVENKNLLKAIY